MLSTGPSTAAFIPTTPTSRSSTAYSRLSALLVVALCVVSNLPSCAALNFNRYNVTMLRAPGQLLSTYTNPIGALTTPAQNPLGPFINSTYLLGPNDDPSMAGTWQIPVTLPWNFSFYGVNYSSITVTSKGFLYFGAYDYLTDLQNLETAAPAPDYSQNGQGFPAIDGVMRPVLSFFHSAGGGVPSYDLVNYGSLNCLKDGTVSQSGGGQCVLADYYWQLLPPIGSSVAATVAGPRKVLTPVTIVPINSVATKDDGQRFTLVALDLRDQSGAQGQSVVVLYQSGLIEVYWYAVSMATQTSAAYLSQIEQPASVGVQSLLYGSRVSFSSPGNINPSMNLSQQLFSSLGGAMKQSSLSFRPVYT